MTPTGVYYSDYLQLDKILGAQETESGKKGSRPAHDEMLFIVIHQTYELWFKQILHEIGSVMQIMAQEQIADNGPDLYMVQHRLNRVNTILRVLVEQVDILETMTPLDFLDFRNLLRPASGFQSLQFKILEAQLGLKMEQRYGREYYVSQLKPDDAQAILQLDNVKPLIELVNEWLERMPLPEGGQSGTKASAYWIEYRKVYNESLVDAENENLSRFDALLMNENTESRTLSRNARRAALFIMLYRDYPLMRLPFQILEALLSMDEGLATWRFRHMNMVHRMIGTRVGTGGSSGKEYLKGALDKHYIFSEFAELTTFLVERSRLPSLSREDGKHMGYGY